jgi:hypothetical protein
VCKKLGIRLLVGLLGRRKPTAVHPVAKGLASVTRVQDIRDAGGGRILSPIVDVWVYPGIHVCHFLLQAGREEVEVGVLCKLVELVVEHPHNLGRLVVDNRLLLLVPQDRDGVFATGVVGQLVQLAHSLGPVDGVWYASIAREASLAGLGLDRLVLGVLEDPAGVLVHVRLGPVPLRGIGFSLGLGRGVENCSGAIWLGQVGVTRRCLQSGDRARETFKGEEGLFAHHRMDDRHRNGVLQALHGEDHVTAICPWAGICDVQVVSARLGGELPPFFDKVPKDRVHALESALSICLLQAVADW